ncbi:---NA--- [Octopus vulgaris]|uniref:---NA n=1 Tax=Octopus vulgaris TaxID=6645 RepID=A0AA36B9Z4_OCTVU|nr:---NA--- [Octopus vulgaris]
MANKSCHTQAIQVPLVNDKNEDNDMQTPTKQETGDPAEKDQTSHEKKQIQSKRSNEERPVCIHYRSNKCKHGLSGTGCTYSHPKPCKPYINFGTDRKKGCQNGRECELLHPKMCRNSLRKKECFGENCKFMHRIKTTEPTPPGPSSAGYENHFPKMRKPGHGSTVNENHATQLHTSAVTNPNSQKFDIVMNESSFLGIIYQLQQQLYSIQMTQQNQATLIQRLTPGLPGHIQQIQTAQQTEYPVSTVPATTTVLPTIGQMYPVQQA